MRILLINPNSDTQTTVAIRKHAELFARDKLIVDCVNLNNTPKLISCKRDWADALPEMLAIVKESEYDAFIVACHADPNLDVLKEVTSKPIVGIAEASMKLASTCGNGFAVISPSMKSMSNKMALARKYHCNDLFMTTVASKSDDYKDLLKACMKAKDYPGVDVIVLGCANYVGLEARLEEEIKIPVIDGVIAALAIAEALVKINVYKNEMRGKSND